MSFVRSVLAAAAILGVVTSELALAQTTAPSQSLSSKIDDVTQWTAQRWNRAKANWEKQTEKWADCQKQAKDQDLTGRTSWSFLASCMTPPSASSKIDDVTQWTTKQWNRAKVKWEKQTENWADCQKQAKDEGLTGRKSWSFLASCMAPSSASSKIDDVSEWTTKQWERAKAKWEKQTENWADCQKQAKDQDLTGRKSWSFLASCMAPASASSKIDDVSEWTTKQWDRAKANWQKETEKWADCQKQAKDQDLTGRKSWSFLASCMSS